MERQKDQVGDLLSLLDGDLQTLFKLVITHRKPIAEGDVRAASVILRKWLCDGLIARLCNDMGVRLLFPILDNEPVLKRVTEELSVDYFMTGGVKLNGLPIMFVYHSSLPQLAQPIVPASYRLSQQVVGLGKFLRQKRVFFQGVFFDASEIIVFVANKLGGAHLGGDRDERDTIIRRAADFMTYGGPLEKLTREPPGPLYQAIEPTATEPLSALHLEIVAAAASFLRMQWNGQPVLEFRTRRSLLDRALDLTLGTKRHAKLRRQIKVSSMRTHSRK